MTTVEAKILAAYVINPRYCVTYCGIIVESIDHRAGHFSLRDGQDLLLEKCSANLFGVMETKTIDWRNTP